MQNQLSKATRPYITPFVLGFLAKEFVTFVKEGGLSDLFPLARCLFLMLLCVSLLFWLWGNDEVLGLKEKLKEIEDEFNGLKSEEERKSAFGASTR